MALPKRAHKNLGGPGKQSAALGSESTVKLHPSVCDIPQIVNYSFWGKGSNFLHHSFFRTQVNSPLAWSLDYITPLQAGARQIVKVMKAVCDSPLLSLQPFVSPDQRTKKLRISKLKRPYRLSDPIVCLCTWGHWGPKRFKACSRHLVSTRGDLEARPPGLQSGVLPCHVASHRGSFSYVSPIGDFVTVELELGRHFWIHRPREADMWNLLKVVRRLAFPQPFMEPAYLSSR